MVEAGFKLALLDGDKTEWLGSSISRLPWAGLDEAGVVYTNVMRLP